MDRRKQRHVTVLIREPYLPEDTGGGLMDLHGLAQEFLNGGHTVEVLCLSRDPRGGRLRRLLTVHCDTANGYPVRRAGSARGLRALVRLRSWLRPSDLVLIQGAGKLELLDVAARAGTAAVVVRAVTAECVDEIDVGLQRVPSLGSRFRPDGPGIPVANSRFVARRLHTVFPDRSIEVHYPVMDLKEGSVATAEHASGPVLMVNPVRVKGVEVVVEVARLLPHRRFILQEAWRQSDDNWHRLVDCVREVPNIELRRRVPDLAPALDEASLLFMPSQWEEAFGRSAVEANAHHVPVIASRVGGLPEAVGTRGGILLEPDAAPADWADAIESLLADSTAYATARVNARKNAERSEFEASRIAEALLRHASSASAARTGNALVARWRGHR